MSTHPIHNPLRAALTMPAPDLGSVCTTPDSQLIHIARMSWYASVDATSPAHEDHFLSAGGNPFDDIGEIDESAFEMFANDLPSYIANLDTGWTQRRDREFAHTGLPLLRLNTADYIKHQLGTTDHQRKDNSSSTGNSQLLTCFDESVQNMLCDGILPVYILQWISEKTGSNYSFMDVPEDTDFFLESMKELFGNGTVRIEAYISGPVGYDLGKSVDTFYLEIDASRSHYHMYPATFSAEQCERAIFAEYEGWTLKEDHAPPC